MAPAGRQTLSGAPADPGVVSDSLLLGHRDDLPPWAEPHWPALLVWELTGIPPEEQIRLLRAQGLPPERALRLALAVPPRTPRGQRDRVRLGARLLFDEPARFWPVVEALEVYWGIHRWSILGEALPLRWHRAWCSDLGAQGSPRGLRFCGALGWRPTIPPNLCASRIEVDQVPIGRLPGGWIVEELSLSNCPYLRGSLADVVLLGRGTVHACPRFDHQEALELPVRQTP